MNLGSYLPLFKKFQTYILTTHLNPDGDGIGSQLALREYLVDNGKSVRCINFSPTPRQYKFLDPEKKLIEVFDQKIHASIIAKTDCIVILDTNVLSRLGDMEEAVHQSPATKIVIDHHLDKGEIADHYIVDESAAATGEIVYKLLAKAMENKLTDTIANALYTAIMTDTGSYRFPKTNYNTHLMTAELLKYNVNPADIYQEVYERGSATRLVLLGETLSTLQLHHDGRVATMYIPAQLFEQTDTDIAETDGFVNYAMQIDNVQIGLLFTENGNDIKISFRSRGDVWVNELAKEFNGNGHQHAAGATVHGGNLQDVMKKVIEAAPKHLP